MTIKINAMRVIVGFGLFTFINIFLAACVEDNKNAADQPQAGSGRADQPQAGSGGTDQPQAGTSTGGTEGSLAGSGGGGGGTVAGNDGNDRLPVGESDFISADGYQGQSTATVDGGVAAGGNTADPMSFDTAAPTERSVEEGDIYRVLSDNRILNLNSYRGLQIIDFSDATNPFIMGRLAVTGQPVELYVVDDKAIVLMNGWTGYYGSRDDVKVDKREGGLVVTVDISDPTQPVLFDRAYVSGYITTSRLTRGADQVALYVAANDWNNPDGLNHTVVKSFDVSGSTIQAKTEIDLGGYVQDIQATTEALLVARLDYSRNDATSNVSIIDISNPNGTMVEGDEVEVAGIVNNKFNMDLTNGILRIASGSYGNMTNTNHVQTYDATDFSELVELDHCSFSDGEQLYATLFLGNKAFFVTYRRTDPFHAFSIDDNGVCEAKSEFIVSGWNDYFRAVFDQQRLIGIGKNDESGGSTMAVSLYDITDLSNSNPLISRAEVALDNSWSEASWDDRAFSVLEDALSEEVANGETGLLLLPFQGWNQQDTEYLAGVQIFTFSKNTLTRRGVMNHGSSVRRSFLADSQTTANLSEERIGFFDHTNPDSPQELGSVELAPNYTQILSFGDYLVRLRNNSEYTYWRGNDASYPDSTAEVIARDDHPDSAVPIAQIQVPYSAYLVKSGDYLVSVNTAYRDSEVLSGSTYSNLYDTTIDVYDMSQPPSPERLGSITTDKLKPYYYSYGGPMMVDCFDCRFGWGGGYGQPEALAVEGALVFVNTESQRRSIGMVHNCYQFPIQPGFSVFSTESARIVPDTNYSGSINCTQVNDGPEVCEDNIELCKLDANDAFCCEPADSGEVALLPRMCIDNEQFRYWNSYSLYVLDLTSAEIQLGDPISFPIDNEGVGVVSAGSSVYFSYKQPHQVEDGHKSYVRYYFVEVDLSNPKQPELSAPVNVPGQLLAVQNDTVYTQDIIWGEEVAQSAINRLDVDGGRAYRTNSYLFADRIVETVKLDGAGHVLVSHQQPWQRMQCGETAQERVVKLTVLDTDELSRLSEIEVDNWANLREARSGKALFEVSGGLMVMNLSDSATPYMQAYFPTPGWPQDILFEQNDILIAAGRYGIYAFDAEDYNLLDLSQ